MTRPSCENALRLLGDTAHLASENARRLLGDTAHLARWSLFWLMGRTVRFVCNVCAPITARSSAKQTDRFKISSVSYSRGSSRRTCRRLVCWIYASALIILIRLGDAWPGIDFRFESLQDGMGHAPSSYLSFHHPFDDSRDDRWMLCPRSSDPAHLQGGAKGDEKFMPNKADISKMAQKLKGVQHGLQVKQIRMLLISDSRLMTKIQRATDSKHLLDCITAAAKRMGIPVKSQSSQQNQDVSQQSSNSTKGKGKGKGQYLPRHEDAETNPLPPNKQDKMQPKLLSVDALPQRSHANAKYHHPLWKGKGKGVDKMQEHRSPVKFSLNPYGWNVQPLQDFVPHHGAVYLTESEEEAKKLAEQAAGKP